jgi:hypothetical protein
MTGGLVRLKDDETVVTTMAKTLGMMPAMFVLDGFLVRCCLEDCENNVVIQSFPNYHIVCHRPLNSALRILTRDWIQCKRYQPEFYS